MGSNIISVRNHIYSTIRDQIVSGELKQGTRMVEAKVAKRLNVSITPVREAFVTLASQGLLTTFPYCGTYVTILSAESAGELIDVRKEIESSCAEKIFNKLSDEDANRLEELCEIADLKNKEGNFLESIEYDIKFHEYMIKKCGNNLILEIWELIRNRIAFYQSVTRPNNQAAMPLIFDRHKKIVEAVREKNFKDYKKALIYHLNKSLERGKLPSEKDINYKL